MIFWSFIAFYINASIKLNYSLQPVEFGQNTVLQIGNPYRTRYFSPFWKKLGASFPESLPSSYIPFPISLCIIFAQWLTVGAFMHYS